MASRGHLGPALYLDCCFLEPVEGRLNQNRLLISSFLLLFQTEALQRCYKGMPERAWNPGIVQLAKSKGELFDVGLSIMPRMEG